ncbi:MAG: hypothetical protein DHS20C09_19210 [marine bacterium B5-7]|nr:MAG: hypothetical protein DHS20C09_19210 [marine bacterium B5-7]
METPNNIYNLNSATKKADDDAHSSQPMVYFGDVSRIHINRFKAYTQIIVDKLHANWEITEDLTKANIVVEVIYHEAIDKKSLQMSVLSGPAHLKPPVIHAFNISFDETKMIKQLNQASKQLLTNDQGENDDKGEAEEPRTDKVIKVCGHLNESLEDICQLFNRTNLQFFPGGDIFSDQSIMYHDQILFLVDPKSPESIAEYQVLMQKKLAAITIIDELTVAIINNPDDESSEDVFDLIYDLADDNTQVTLINLTDQSELDVFVNYF